MKNTLIKLFSFLRKGLAYGVGGRDSFEASMESFNLLKSKWDYK